MTHGVDVYMWRATYELTYFFFLKKWKLIRWMTRLPKYFVTVLFKINGFTKSNPIVCPHSSSSSYSSAPYSAISPPNKPHERMLVLNRPIPEPVALNDIFSVKISDLGLAQMKSKSYILFLDFQ